MRIEVETFYELCRVADLPITNTEKKVMKKVKGDRERFLAICRRIKLPITKNEEFFLKWTPTLEDDSITAWEKTNIALAKAKKLRKVNKYGL